jgi:hypothetical protein
MKIRIELTGTAPLLMHSVRAADPLHPLAKEMKKISKKRTKTEEDYAELARLDWQAGLYCDDVLGPYLPSLNVAKSLIEGARVTKQGKTVERGLLIVDDAPLLYSGPRDPDGLWADHTYRHSAIVKVGMSRVNRYRPVFRQWAAEFDADMDESVLDLDALQEIASTTGRMIGVGDWRPRHGRFEAVVTRTL